MPMGRMLITAGVVLVIVGIVISLGPRLPFRFGQLPGDVVYRGRNTTFYFPVVTCVVLSIVLSALMYLFNRR